MKRKKITDSKVDFKVKTGVRAGEFDELPEPPTPPMK